MSEEKKKTILSGIQPTGRLHIGNYIGAIKNWVAMQDEYQCYYTIVDLHSITIRQVPAELRNNTLNLGALLLNSKKDKKKSVLFVQSHVPEHGQLAWVLNCFTQMGELNRMTQFKDKSAKHSDNINAGLFSYPVLQAADILLYQADKVPVGQDQKQHLELTRDIANRFNNAYSPTFTVPDPFIPKFGAKVMSLQEPDKKMSKSDENENSSIFITDPDNVIRKKLMRAVTDSGSEIKYDEENKAGVSNLMSLYHIATGRSFEQIEIEFEGAGYGDFKKAVGDAMVEYIRPVRDRFEEVRSNKKLLQEVLADGAQKASKTAFKTLRKVYKKVGFVQF